MSKIVFAMGSANVWCHHLDILAAHLGASDYDVMLLDQRDLSLADLPEGITNLPELEEVKDVQYEKRRIERLVPTQRRPLEAPPDIHRKILTYLSGAEVALTLQVSRYWRTTAERHWKLWYQLRRQDSISQIGPIEFRGLAGTPAEAYRLSEPVRLYIDALKCASNLSHHFLPRGDIPIEKDEEIPPLEDEDRTPLLVELTREEDGQEAKHPTPEFNSDQDFDFEVTLPIFDRIYRTIRENFSGGGLFSYFVLRNLIRNLGRTGSASTISEFYISVTKFNDRLYASRGDAYITEWLSSSPGRKYFLPFVLNKHDRDVRLNIFHHLWLGTKNRKEVADVLTGLL